MKLYGYTTAYNVSRLIPYVMPYVERLEYDKFIVYDNESTDNTVELLKQYPFVEIRTFEMEGLDDYKKMDLQRQSFEECRELSQNGEQIWMTWTDFDEVLFANCNMPFRYELDFRYNLFGYYNYFAGHMVNLFFPDGRQHIPHKGELIHMNSEVRGSWWMADGNKPILLLVNCVEDVKFHVGNHIMGVKPKGSTEMRNLNEVGFFHSFHLKFIDLENTIKTSKTYFEEGHNGYKTLCNEKYIKDNLSMSFSMELYSYFKFFESTWERKNIRYPEGIYYLN